MSDQRITVLICTHNYGRFLKQAIDAALVQTYKNLSICIVDDGSVDNTKEVLQNYIPFDTDRLDYDDSTIRSYYTTINDVSLTVILKPTCTGPSDARNIGIRATIENTDAYVIADSDDEMLPEKVERMVNTWAGNEQIGVVYGDYETLNEQDNRTREYKEVYSYERLKSECIIHSASFVTKLALESVKEGDDYYCSKLRVAEDYDLWLRVLQTKMATHIPENLTTVRVHSQDSTHSVKNEVWQNNYSLVMRRLAERQNGGVPHV